MAGREILPVVLTFLCMKPVLREDTKHYVKFDEWKEVSAFDHIKLAFNKMQKKDAIAYVLIVAWVAWFIGCWFVEPDMDKNYGLHLGVNITRVMGIILVIYSSFCYLLNWYYDKKK